ncbi:hypothetical protein PoB_001371800 [Plakobranchus ocellatus]|uniref:Uncharacterized protein n=1 Tax=Plakobranchus ocellatus TaxID=259542 RepID=A0AAV3YXE4_9GAST|nr:hypothetical protein PoB_001371800 [Plakobranchus ocellatus]
MKPRKESTHRLSPMSYLLSVSSLSTLLCPPCGARGRIGSTVAAAGRKRQPRQVVAYGLPLVQNKVTSLSPPSFFLLSPLPFLRYRPVYLSFCYPLLLSLPMWSLG